jgi:hypothetical protein
VQLARRLSPSDPLHAFTPTTGLVLVGPFEVLGALGSEQAVSGFSTAIPSSAPELHLGWRFPFDPPEVMTVIVSTNPQAGIPPTESTHACGPCRRTIAPIALQRASTGGTFAMRRTSFRAALRVGLH